MLHLNPYELPAIVRPDCPFDIKGALTLSAIRQLGRCVIMDIDALLLKDPTTHLLAMNPHSPFGMALDGGARGIIGHEHQKEHNAGVLYFGDKSGIGRSGLACLYLDAFRELTARGNSSTVEQVAWSLVWHRLDTLGLATLLPKVLNWSRFWPASPETVVLHEHGERKWEKYGITANA